MSVVFHHVQKSRLDRGARRGRALHGDDLGRRVSPGRAAAAVKNGHAGTPIAIKLVDGFGTGLRVGATVGGISLDPGTSRAGVSIPSTTRFHIWSWGCSRGECGWNSSRNGRSGCEGGGATLFLAARAISNPAASHANWTQSHRITPAIGYIKIKRAGRAVEVTAAGTPIFISSYPAGTHHQSGKWPCTAGSEADVGNGKQHVHKLDRIIKTTTPRFPFVFDVAGWIASHQT